MSAPTYYSATETTERNKYLLPGLLAGLIVLVLFALWLMRGAPDLETGYGRRNGDGYKASVNGTSVLAEMFRRRGHSVVSTDRLSPALRRYNTIVWFPDDFDVPKSEQREFLEEWLWEGLNSGVQRTVIYVGRDYDAATAYWTRIQPQAPPEQQAEVKRQLAQAKSKFDTERTRLPTTRFGGWFTLRDGPRRKVTTISGDWAAGIDARQTDITVASTLGPPQQGDVDIRLGYVPDEMNTQALLASGNDVLISKVTMTDNEWGGGQIIVVANGSMLLNYPLVNKENRKIASKLIGECPDGAVAFLESGRGGPPVEHKAVKKKKQDWPFPMNAIIYHLVALAVIYCLSRFAIFGRPWTLPTESPADFGKHIQALGKLMQKTKDQAYAYARLQQYRQHGKRDSGKSHKK
jgi:hypothetical protein